MFLCCNDSSASKPVESLDESPVRVSIVLEATPSSALSKAMGNKVSYVIELRRNGPEEKMGLDVAHKGRFLKVKQVKAGVVMKWNEDNPDNQVRPNDLIIDVNGLASSGVEISSQKLLEGMATVRDSAIKLTLMRY
mmetsp:Transcript_68551/g.174045  ORF Transcript_68551/g.174045 Transcript_68551/m.174045 type:complete len:136 (+) Transcript_68551:98-505(+)